MKKDLITNYLISKGYKEQVHFADNNKINQVIYIDKGDFDESLKDEHFYIRYNTTRGYFTFNCTDKFRDKVENIIQQIELNAMEV